VIRRWAVNEGPTPYNDDLLVPAEAARLLGVPEDRIPVLVDEGLLTPVDGPDGPRFAEAEVRALRLLGG
jgi:hypothetical protein